MFRHFFVACKFNFKTASALSNLTHGSRERRHFSDRNFSQNFLHSVALRSHTENSASSFVDVAELVAIGKACEYPVGIIPTEENGNAADGTVADEIIEDPSVSLFEEVLRSIYRDKFRTAADKITPKEKQILSLSLGVCFDCFGVFKPSTYAEIALKQGASGEKSIEKNARRQSKNLQRNFATWAFATAFS